MALSRENIIWTVTAFAAFGLGGFLALPNSKTNLDVSLVSAPVSEAKQPLSTQSSTPQSLQTTRVELASATAPQTCNQRCQADVEKFQAWSKDIGRASEGGLDQAAEYAAYIQERPALKEQLISLAENQADGDFSRLLVASFQYLEPADKLDLSQALMSSPAWDIRRKTTSLLISHDVLSTQDAAKITSLLSKETDSRVVAPILQALGQSPEVKTKPEIMDYLNQRVANVQDPEIRGAALVAQTQLSLDGVTEMPMVVLEALRSGDPEYSSYGFQSADLVLSKLSKANNGTKASALQETKRALDLILNAEYDPTNAEDDLMPDRIYREAQDLYSRYFG